MIRKHMVAVFIVGLSSALLSAACAGVESAPPETEGSGGANGDDNEVEQIRERDDPSSWVSELVTSGDSPLLAVCLALAPASVAAKVGFCDVLPDRGMYARCMSHRFNRLEWVGWCYFEFSD